MSSQLTTQPLRLYKLLLRGCQTFPSKNAPKLYQEIRVEFREHKDLKPPQLEVKLAEAAEGVKHLAQYNNLPKTSSNWAISSTQNPMPQKPEPKK
ncbi:hypothetical protein TrST_g9851 [Triparma strigata]|uniref:Complex 1 LYR protein domain-containing protein n=1 Tax=Triparma strigata TaxID=1606541 RepID=A0A9W7ANY2_9STRA|nr:hypothetical protein TrST_g9851 [Triparma strigata]